MAMLSMKWTLLSIPVGLAIGCGGASIGRSPGPDTVPTAGPAATSGGAASTASGARVVEVEANQGWQDTGIRVAPQQRVQLRYRSGQITDKDIKIADGHGSGYICGDPGCCEPMPDERRGTLLGRIGGNVFIVGNGGEHSAPESGTIFLRVNDCDDGLVDNTGQLKVEFIP
jgi:hypothetical protein